MDQYFMPAARCQESRQLVKKQDLSGRRYSQKTKSEAWLVAEVLAEDLSARTRQTWTPELITYTDN